MNIKAHQLKNGLKVFLIDTQAFPSVATLLLVGAGSRYENKINNGVAHFFEHMAFKGSQKYPTALTISTLLDSLGSQQNAFTGKDHTGYWIKAPLKHFETVIDVLSEMVLHSLLKTEEIEREKGVIIEEINMYEDLPQYKVWDLFENLIFPNNPLGYLTTGSKDSVSKFTKKTFVDYMDALYKPNNSVLVVAGGLGKDEEKIKKAIETKFAQWQNRPTLNFQPISKQQTQKHTHFYSKKTEQAHFILGYEGLPRDDDHKYILLILAAILGGGMSSRLFYELRERRGLCYYIQSGTDAYQETGYLFTRAGVNVSQDKIEQAISLILQEHQKIVQGQIKTDELNKAKEMIKGRTILSLEDSFNLASFFGKKALFKQKEKTLQEVFVKIDKVTVENVINLARTIIKEEKLNFAIISPHKKLTI